MTTGQAGQAAEAFTATVRHHMWGWGKRGGGVWDDYSFWLVGWSDGGG